jgi:hypothetical protein
MLKLEQLVLEKKSFDDVSMHIPSFTRFLTKLLSQELNLNLLT